MQECGESAHNWYCVYFSSEISNEMCFTYSQSLHKFAGRRIVSALNGFSAARFPSRMHLGKWSQHLQSGIPFHSFRIDKNISLRILDSRLVACAVGAGLGAFFFENSAFCAQMKKRKYYKDHHGFFSL